MKCIVTLVVVAAAVAVTAGIVLKVHGEDVKFNLNDLEPSMYDKLVSLNEKAGGPRPSVKGFKFNNCGDPKTDIANISSIVLGPDPVVFPGVITVSFSVNFSKTLDAPLKGQVKLSKKVGSTWIEIPCIGKIGSCDYDDVCDLLKNAVCPPPFVSNKIPCKCPFTKGNYSLPTSKFQVNVPVFPNGDYHAVGKLSYNDASVACVELFVTFG